jgi:hypothetical protein
MIAKRTPRDYAEALRELARPVGVPPRGKHLGRPESTTTYRIYDYLLGGYFL